MVDESYSSHLLCPGHHAHTLPLIYIYIYRERERERERERGREGERDGERERGIGLEGWDTVEAEFPDGLLHEIQVFVSVSMDLLQLRHRVRLRKRERERERERGGGDYMSPKWYKNNNILSHTKSLCMCHSTPQNNTFHAFLVYTRKLSQLNSVLIIKGVPLEQ